MTDVAWNPIYGAPTYPADRYAILARRIGAILKTDNDILLVQAEAVVALEAVATSLARSGLSALNIVTSPYGSWFGQWLRRDGTDIIDTVARPGLPIEVGAVAEALDANPDVGVLALVHAESASGILNPLPEIVAMARARGIVTIVDAVASVGGHSLDVGESGIDIAVIGPQKALGGPAGVSAISVSARAWELILRDDAPRDSILSLADLKAWVAGGSGALPGTPAPLEFFALEAALDRVEAERIEQIVIRHETAASASRAGLAALGARLWVPAEKASNLVTTISVPESIETASLIRFAAGLDVELTAGIGAGASHLLRFNHTGPRANFQTVMANTIGYALALRQAGFPADIGAAAEAVAKTYGAMSSKFVF